MPKQLSAYEKRIDAALAAEDKRIKEEELAKKLIGADGKKKRNNDEYRKGVRSEQPLEDETNTNYMHDDPQDDGYLRPYLAWRYCLKQLGNPEATGIIADPKPDNERAYPLLNCELHGHQIWMHKAEGHVVAQKSTTVTQAFGNFMYSKMVRTLRDRDLVVRQKSITWAVELLCVPDNRARCIAAGTHCTVTCFLNEGATFTRKAYFKNTVSARAHTLRSRAMSSGVGFLPILADMLKEKDLYIRQQLALCFKYCGAAITTWADMCKLGCIKGLIDMIGEDNWVLRGNALNALNDLALSCEVREEIVNNGSTLETIVIGIEKDPDRNNQCLALDLLSRCMAGLNYNQKAITECIQAGAVQIVVKLANTLYENMMVSAARFICCIGFDEPGRKFAVTLGAVTVFVPYLSHVDARVMAYGTAALISLTLEVKGKKAFITAKGVPVLAPMLNLSDGELTLLVMNLIINVTEDPAARANLQVGIRILRTMILETMSGTLKKCARQTIQELQFQSRPFQNLKDVR